MIRRILLIAAALAAAIATLTHWSVLMIAVALYATTVILSLVMKAAPRSSGDSDQTGAAIVISVATAIVVLHADADAVSLWEVATVLALLHGLHLVRHVLRVLVYRRWRGSADWRNLVVAAPVPKSVDPVAGPTLVAIPVWVIAPILAIFDADPFVYLLLGVVCLGLVIGTLVPISRALLHNLRMPSETVRLAALTAALRKQHPEILVHFNARAGSAYAITEWMTVLERLAVDHRVVIVTVDRQPWHFDTIPATSIPLVHLVGAEAIEYVVEQVPTLAVALYPRNTSPNKNLLRVPGLYDVYIGHGESDKAEAVNPATRAFDEIWIAGEAARARYLDANIGVHENQLRITGRPQVGELLELAALTIPGPKKSVVYAPTWEGYYAEDGYSSIVTHGAQVVATLLERDDVRVTYLPHPALGTLNGRFADASDSMVSRLRHSGGRSVIAGTLSERYAVLAAADVLVTDVGSDLVDFLALDRPYFVVNDASIVTLGDDVGRSLAAPEKDPARQKLALRYLGDLSTPPIDRFLAEVDRTLALVRKSRRQRTLPVPEGVAE
jgi:CDP-Glycerol:Poly(glycerophosphate) glycerophosphotransferase